MARKTCKFYYQAAYGRRSIVDKSLCCKLMKIWWSVGYISFDWMDMQIVASTLAPIKYCPACGAKIIIKEGRL